MYVVKCHYLNNIGEGSEYEYDSRHGPISNDDPAMDDMDAPHAGMNEGHIIGVYADETAARLKCLSRIQPGQYDPNLRFNHGKDTWKDHWNEMHDFFSIEVWSDDRQLGIQRLDFDAWFKHKIHDTKMDATSVSAALQEWNAAIRSGIVPEELAERFVDKFVLFATKKKKKTPRDIISGFAKPVRISAELCEFLGVSPGTLMARTEVTLKINQYIKDHNLQNAENVRHIDPDEKLNAILNSEEEGPVTFFNLQARIKHHFSQ